MKQRIPSFETDEQAEDFVATADLSHYDLSGGTMVRFDFAPDEAIVQLSLPTGLLKAFRGRAERSGLSYENYIRIALERDLLNP